MESGNTDGRSPLVGLKILVVDDDPDALTFIGMVLEDAGAIVAKAADGEEALDLARRDRPDLVTLDLGMPGKDGIEVFVEMRRDPALREIPVCVITGRPELRKLIYERAHHAPPEGYLGKPVNAKTLLRDIRRIVELQRRSRQRDPADR